MDERTKPARGERVPPRGKMAQERAERELNGKNWEARHVADLIALSELTVKRMARGGRLPALKVGRSWEFPPAKIRAWYAGEPWEIPRRPRRRRRAARGRR